MANNPKPIAHGTAGGVAISVDLARIEHGTAKKVTLTAPYQILTGGGVPTRPGLTGAPAALLDYPRTLSVGTTLTLLAGEADALVAAGKATYA